MIVGQFVLKPLLDGREQRRVEGVHDRAPTYAVAPEHDDSDDEEKSASAQTKYLRHLIAGSITHKMQEMVRDIMNLSGEEAAFPVRPGSHLRLTNAALEFVKSVCHILSLETTVAGEVQLLRQNLLRIIQVREFSAESAFHDPCLTYVLHDVMCSNCNATRDVDLARDTVRVQREEDDADSPGVLAWVCTLCSQPYSDAHIELMLVQIVQRRSMAYQVQDLYCSKCRSVKASKLQDYCRCSGRFVNAEGPEPFRQSMRVFLNIANHHNFLWLRDTVMFVLQH